MELQGKECNFKMKKELVITAIILVLIIVANNLTQNYTKKCVTDISSKLENLKDDALSEKKESKELASMAEEIYQDWVQKSKYLSYYLEHNELEKVHSQIRIAKGFFEAEEISDGVPELENCIYILHHIQQKEEFNLKNIF